MWGRNRRREMEAKKYSGGSTSASGAATLPMQKVRGIMKSNERYAAKFSVFWHLTSKGQMQLGRLLAACAPGSMSKRRNQMRPRMMVSLGRYPHVLRQARHCPHSPLLFLLKRQLCTKNRNGRRAAHAMMYSRRLRVAALAVAAMRCWSCKILSYECSPAH